MKNINTYYYNNIYLLEKISAFLFFCIVNCVLFEMSCSKTCYLTGIERLAKLLDVHHEQLNDAFDECKCKGVISFCQFVSKSGSQCITSDLCVQIRTKGQGGPDILSVFNIEIDITKYNNLESFLNDCFNNVDLNVNLKECKEMVKCAKEEKNKYDELMKKNKDELTDDDKAFLKHMNTFVEKRGFCRDDVIQAFLNKVYVVVLWIMFGARYQGKYVNSNVNACCTECHEVTKIEHVVSKTSECKVDYHIGDIIEYIIQLNQLNKDSKILAQFCMDVNRIFGGVSEGTGPVMEEIVSILTDLLCYMNNQQFYPLTKVTDEISGKFFVQETSVIFNTLFKMLSVPIPFSALYCAGVPFYKLKSAIELYTKCVHEYPEYLYNLYTSILQYAHENKYSDVILTLLGMGVYGSEKALKFAAVDKIADAIINARRNGITFNIHVVCLGDNEEFAQYIVNKCESH